MFREPTPDGKKLPRSPEDIENAMALIEKSQQLAGHFPSEDDLAAARRLLTGESTYEEEMEIFYALYPRDSSIPDE